jgi:hypothetical protein
MTGVSNSLTSEKRPLVHEKSDLRMRRYCLLIGDSSSEHEPHLLDDVVNNDN